MLEKKKELSYDSAIPPCLYTQKMKAGPRATICTSMTTATLLATAKRQQQPESPSTDEWINKLWDIHVMGIFQP